MLPHARRLLYRLRDAARAEESAIALRHEPIPGVVEGLCDLLDRASAPAATAPIAAGVAAARVLAGRDGPRAREALIDALDAGAAPIRLEAAVALERFLEPASALALTRRLRLDDAPVVRHAALHALARLPAPPSLGVVHSLADPVWRVRRDAVRRIEEPPPRGLGLASATARSAPRSPGTARFLGDLRAAIAALGPLDDAASASIAYLEQRTGARLRDGDPSHANANANAAPQRAPWWDEDPPVLLENVRHATDAELGATLFALPSLLTFQDGRPYDECAQRLRGHAIDALDRLGSEGDLAAVVELLAEPRRPFVRAAVEDLLGHLDRARRTTLADHVLHARRARGGALVWAVEAAGPAAFSERAAELLYDASESVREASIQRLSSNSADHRAWRLDALRDSDDRVRCAALAGLGDAPLDVVTERMDAGGSAIVRRAWTTYRLAHRDRSQASIEATVAAALADPDARVRAVAAAAIAEAGGGAALDPFTRDADDRVRAAALTPALAAAITRDPEREPSVRVVAAAARLVGVSLVAIAPDAAATELQKRPPARIEISESPYLRNRPTLDTRERGLAARRDTRDDGPPDPPAKPLDFAADRPFGATGLRLPAMAISGRYGLAEEAFAEALDRGVKLLFWEPVYEGQTRYLRHLPAHRRQTLSLIAGSFEADPREIRRDAEKALRLLRVDAIDVFVLFWVRSAARMNDDVVEVLTRLRDDGLIKTHGLSTHRRDLAAEAIEQGWPSVMVRHNAAHRGAETEVFPLAQARGAGVLTFSNICYGRMLRPEWGSPPTAAECYRYSLSQPGVTTCISGPRDLDQLRENLPVLADPSLDPERIASLQRYGAHVHQDNRRFFELMRWR